MLEALTVVYLLCFQCAAIPAMTRLVRRRSSSDLSVWREWLVLAGVAAQLAVYVGVGVRDWRVLVSPVASGASVAALLALIYRYRHA